MKAILVTGGCGFIGSHFVIQQISAGNIVINIDKLTYAADLNNLSSVQNHKNYKFIKGDICDVKTVSNIFKNSKIEWVVNFAAESHVDNSIEKPAEFIQTNIYGVYNLLQNALEYWNKLEGNLKENFRFLQISTDEVFGSLGDIGKFNEETRYDPSSPYSASKASADHLVKAWHRTFGLPILLTNCSNNFGPHQHREKLIPKIILNCINEKPIPIYGNGKNIRDWIYVGDHCEGIKLALEKGKIGNSYCFGGNCEKTNNELVGLICRKLDQIRPRRNGKSYKEFITYVADRPGHDSRYAIDDTKSRQILGYSQSKSFDERILETIHYYLDTIS